MPTIHGGNITLLAACRRERTFLSREFSRFPQVAQAGLRHPTHVHVLLRGGGEPKRRWEGGTGAPFPAAPLTQTFLALALKPQGWANSR